MDDLYLTPTESKRVDRLRAPGPDGFDVDLPAPIGKWKFRVHPKTKEATVLLHSGWERGPALRILASFKLHVHDWTKTYVKDRSSMSTEKRETAPTLFRLDPFGTFADKGQELRDLRVAHPRDADADEIPNARQIAKIATYIAANIATDDDKPTLKLHCDLNAADGVLYVELVRVYDMALCHFIYECCKPDLSRLLNSERIKALNAATPTEFKWKQHEETLLNQLKDTAESDDLLTFFLLAREDGLHVQLWISERRASRVLLEKDGVKLKEATWLSYTLHFITADERILLKVPADRDQSAYGMGTGY